MILRIICVETDSGDAANIGGPVRVAHKSFDVQCPAELEHWLSLYDPKNDRYFYRGIQGVEVRNA